MSTSFSADVEIGGVIQKISIRPIDIVNYLLAVMAVCNWLYAMSIPLPEIEVVEKVVHPLSKAEIDKLVSLYRQKTGKSKKWMFTDMRKKKMLARAEEAKNAGLNPCQYCEQIILGAVSDPWLSGDNPQQKVYLEWEKNLFASAEVAQRCIAHYETNVQNRKQVANKFFFTCSVCREEIEGNPYEGNHESNYICRRCFNDR